MITFQIDHELATVKPELEYVLKTWSKNSGFEFDVIDSGNISIGRSQDCHLQISKDFADRNFTQLKLNKDGLVEVESGKPDYIATVFYLINSVQEYNSNDLDELNRFKFINSYQCQLNNSENNIVQYCFDKISQAASLPVRNEKSSFFLSHDVDMVYGAWLEDGFNAIKKGRIDQFLLLMLNMAIGRPDWLNMDKITKLESEYDCKSVFYWLVNKGVLNKRERNSDYTFQSKPIQKQFKVIHERGFENGIHKSISQESFQEEIKKFGTQPLGNRYHYLKFTLPEAYSSLEAAGLKLDASLGFAEQPGFRNNYGLPFNPYDFTKRKPHTFVEVPLHIMDRTFFQYQKSSLKDAESAILGFFEKNQRNCVLSVLWHNNFFTDFKFKGYQDLYKKILGYIRDNNFKTVSQKEIIQTFSIV